MRLIQSESQKIDSVLYANILNAVKSNKYYQILTERKFKRKTGYHDFLDIMRYPALFLECAEAYGVDVLQQQDFSHFLHACYTMLQTSKVFPVYAPSRKLIELILQTDLPSDTNLLGQIKKPFNNALFVLPSNILKDESGSTINWVFLSWFDIDDYESAYGETYMKFLNGLFGSNFRFNYAGVFGSDEKYRIKWISLCPDQAAYQSCYGISYHGEMLYGDVIYHNDYVRQDCSDGSTIEVIKDFTERVNSLMMQICMYMQTPRYEENLLVTDSKNITTATAQPQSNVREYINVDLPLSYQSPTPKKPHQGGTHASPNTHWRRGHWRNARVGEKRQEQKLIWIPPAMVNPMVEIEEI